MATSQGFQKGFSDGIQNLILQQVGMDHWLPEARSRCGAESLGSETRLSLYTSTSIPRRQHRECEFGTSRNDLVQLISLPCNSLHRQLVCRALRVLKLFHKISNSDIGRLYRDRGAIVNRMHLWYENPVNGFVFWYKKHILSVFQVTAFRKRSIRGKERDEAWTERDEPLNNLKRVRYIDNNDST